MYYYLFEIILFQLHRQILNINIKKLRTNMTKKNHFIRITLIQNKFLFDCLSEHKVYKHKKLSTTRRKNNFVRIKCFQAKIRFQKTYEENYISPISLCNCIKKKWLNATQSANMELIKKILNCLQLKWVMIIHNQ